MSDLEDIILGVCDHDREDMDVEEVLEELLVQPVMVEGEAQVSHPPLLDGDQSSSQSVMGPSCLVDLVNESGSEAVPGWPSAQEQVSNPVDSWAEDMKLEGQARAAARAATTKPHGLDLPEPLAQVEVQSISEPLP